MVSRAEARPPPLDARVPYFTSGNVQRPATSEGPHRWPRVVETGRAEQRDPGCQLEQGPLMVMGPGCGSDFKICKGPIGTKSGKKRHGFLAG